MLQSSIEIAASPAAVRAKFLDFPSLPTYHSSFFKTIESPKPGPELSKGDKIAVTLTSSKFTGVIEENSPTRFAWTGSLPFVFTGTHVFRFEASGVTQGGTTFTQEERFSGALAWVMGEGVVGRQVGMREKTRRGWEGFNREFKGVCEGEGGGVAGGM